MKMLTKPYVIANKDFILKEIKSGKIFIYPTDTIYGIGCDATNDSAVRKIREIKKRNEKPFSVIAPSMEWITNNCETSSSKDSRNWLRRLPGPFTLILKMRNKEAFSAEVNKGLETLGIRMPDHWFTEIIKEINLPFVTTSVNLSDEPFMTDFYNLHPFIKEQVDYVIYEGSKQSKPSTIVDLTSDKEKIIER